MADFWSRYFFDHILLICPDVNMRLKVNTKTDKMWCDVT